MPAPQNLICSFLLAIADRQSEKGEKQLVQSPVIPHDIHKYALAKCYTEK